ncbi:MAG TPA: DUF362 domain-containing protein [bacterium]|jgi:uncharacterized protein (DUF362 family)|nr:DUF362 domain-containing protein [Dictyoglomota bacterium]HHV81061.1 DUF362 domain-containing protein [bacterium]HOK29004.1 DUF362 domain-containing protein [bacterium]HOL54574.1 DUF362 domain-containing protein [bacterium]HPO81336.1 DUF362 domain-containing protein [bacterium]
MDKEKSLRWLKVGLGLTILSSTVPFNIKRENVPDLKIASQINLTGTLVSQTKEVHSIANVSIVKESSIRESVRKAISMAGDLDFIKPGDTVLVKPNVNSDDPYPGTTNPEVIRELVSMCYEKGAKKVIIADRSGVSWQNTLRNMEKTGIAQAGRSVGADVLALDNEEWIMVKPEKTKYWVNGFRIPKIVTEVDHLINVAVVKTHSIADFSMSLKNFVGFIHMSDRMFMHSSGNLKEMIAELNLAFNPKLNILDASKVFVSGGPDRGEVKIPMMIIAGDDRVAVDITGLALLRSLGTTPAIQSRDIWSHPQIKRAIELEIGIKNHSSIKFTGSNVDIAQIEHLSE